MNKLVIIGNGFDLAHGLPTSYSHFMDSFWENLKNNFQNELIGKVVYVNPDYFKLLNGKYKNFKEFQERLKEYSEEYGYRYDGKNYGSFKDNSNFHPIFKFKNDFFKYLNLKALENWVDVENEYYNELKSISKRRASHFTGNKDDFEKQQIINNRKYVAQLNKEFNQIKKLFISYLNNKVESQLSLDKEPNNAFSILKYFKMDYLDLKNNPNSDFLHEFPQEDHEDLIKGDSDYKEYLNSDSFFYDILRFNHPYTLFLNFNYTSSVSYYNGHVLNNEKGYARIINIHGSIKDDEESINFGFGDEIDKDYKYIENLNENEYLKNFKSFKYSQNSNYKKLLDFIDSEKFQVYIMGHSCGLSDRTLLNTIFEHENCRSIKVFYHKREDGSDNFTEIIQNISRHFSDKKEMRAKLVNKSLCEPLPQNIRFQKKER
ncbi:AbiH family protein [uncultured Croceitalea sp.]|uniref:AbiH family protein n=1 Tax=uncultured Croceitalea sp. TaxID=1798908 RepID=UPI003305C98F